MSRQTIEFCSKRDLPELMTCFADWYRFNPRLQEPDYFDWQFKNAPKRLADAEYDFLILRHDDRIVGCLGFTGFEFVLNGRAGVGGWTHNWYAQDQRDGGLALLGRFMELVDNRVIIRFNENTERIFSLLRVPMIPKIPRWWAAVDADAVGKLFAFDGEDLAVIARSCRALCAVNGGDDVRSVQHFAPLEEFSLSHFGDGMGHARRDGRYLNWRYFVIPRHAYRAIRDDGAFAVYRVDPVMGADVSVIRLLEWTFPAQSTPHALGRILRDASHARPILMDWECTCPAVAEVLEPFGFVRQDGTSKPMPDLFRPTNYSGGNAIAIDLPPHRTARTIDFDHWYVTRGDSDVDRVKL